MQSNIYSYIKKNILYFSEVIMTFGGSKTVEEFLKSAAKKRKFEVICVESSPS